MKIWFTLVFVPAKSLKNQTLAESISKSCLMINCTFNSYSCLFGPLGTQS